MSRGGLAGLEIMADDTDLACEIKAGRRAELSALTREPRCLELVQGVCYATSRECIQIPVLKKEGKNFDDLEN